MEKEKKTVTKTKKVVAKKTAPVETIEKNEGSVAVIETGSKQYIVQKDTIFSVEKLDTKNKSITFQNVVAAKNGTDIHIGAPYVDSVSVKADIISHELDDKIVVFKFKPKTGYRKKQGHRQKMTTLKVSAINFADSKKS